jgi:uncharacterized membrane-anchored protein
MNAHRHSLAIAAVLTLLLAVGSARAAQTETYSPPGLQPLPEIPPPSNADEPDAAPQITVIQKDRETVEEARVNGNLVWIKVTPRHGRPYYLVPDGGGHTYIRRDSLDTALKVPMWVLFTW